MTKGAVIRDLFESGVKESARIAELTGYSLQYVRNVVCDARQPGRATGWARAYWHRKGPSARCLCTKRWRKEHRAASNVQRRRQYRRDQLQSKATAWSTGADWTMREVRFIRAHRAIMTTSDLARALGRSWSSIRRVLVLHCPPSGGERTVGRNWNRPERVA